VAEAEGRIIATSGLVLFWRPPNVSNPTGRDGLVINVYTLPEWRGQGIARRLLETLIAHTRTTSVRRLWLYATEEGHPLYAKLGFQPIDDGMELRLT
jgi:GNAT superfamily N-acetyltransferase